MFYFNNTESYVNEPWLVISTLPHYAITAANVFLNGGTVYFDVLHFTEILDIFLRHT
jgi:hypothetical protein